MSLDKTTFAQMMTMFCEVYDKPLTKTLSNTYYFLLQDMEDEDFKQAVKQMMKERTYATLPKPAEILERTGVKEVVVQESDEVEERALYLIDMVKATNDNIYNDSARYGIPFDDLLAKAKLNLASEDYAVLKAVKPHCDVKQLIAGINTYGTSLDTLKAFMNAIKYGGTNMIENKTTQNLRIKR